MRLTTSLLAASIVFVTACDLPPVGSQPTTYAAAEHGLPPMPQPLPPDDGVCWVEGPNCSGICTPCPEK